MSALQRLIEGELLGIDVPEERGAKVAYIEVHGGCSEPRGVVMMAEDVAGSCDSVDEAEDLFLELLREKNYPKGVGTSINFVESYSDPMDCGQGDNDQAARDYERDRI